MPGLDLAALDARTGHIVVPDLAASDARIGRIAVPDLAALDARTGRIAVPDLAALDARTGRIAVVQVACRTAQLALGLVVHIDQLDLDHIGYTAQLDLGRIVSEHKATAYRQLDSWWQIL